MSSSVILRKEHQWYILPEVENKDELIFSLIKKDNPNFNSDDMNLSDILRLNGWTMEECRNLTEVA